MAKVVNPKTKPTFPDSLSMHLFGPGMSPLHRAGLGGLACTLLYIEREFNKESLDENEVPGGPWEDGKAPWTIDSQKLTLRFGKPENAGEFLRRLFKLAFRLNDLGLIYFPSQHLVVPRSPILADLQSGLLLTFFQHVGVRKLEGQNTVQYDPEGEGLPTLFVTFSKCLAYKLQERANELVDKKGHLVERARKIDGPQSPGTIVRHNAFAPESAIVDTPERVTALMFAPIGCLALPISRKSAVLIVPEVENLIRFSAARPFMTPTKAEQCQIASATDGALQAQVRLRSSQLLGKSIPSAYAMTLDMKPWARQQKTRVASVQVMPESELALTRFEIALQLLPTRIVGRTVKEKTRSGNNKANIEGKEAFRANSVVRPLVADNIAMGRPWYAGFTGLMTARGDDKKPIRDKLRFELKGIQDMIENPTVWNSDSEKTIVKAVHVAMRSRFRQIAKENQGNPVARKNRSTREKERWRLAFVSSKTPNQFRGALCDLFSKAGSNSVLQESWIEIISLLDDDHWQLARDLALLALVSYLKKKPGNPVP
jgi:CRISPR-associated protein Cas8a1/Csx13